MANLLIIRIKFVLFNIILVMRSKIVVAKLRCPSQIHDAIPSHHGVRKLTISVASR